MNYISMEIHFDMSKIDYPNDFWKKLKTLFYKTDESQIM